MKQIIFEKYKLAHIILTLLVGLALWWMNINYENWYKDIDTASFYNYYYALYAPIFSGGKWLLGILVVLLFFPSRIFKKWLFFVLPIPLFLTYWLVQDISVYGGGVLYISRAQMAENGMLFLAGVTVLFVVGHLLYDWKKGNKLW
jgi:hypothetical protein